MKLVIKIIKQSIMILLVASVISSVGGVGLDMIQKRLLSIVPLLILLPALNDMMGDFGTIVSSRFTTLLYLYGSKVNWWKSKRLHKLMRTVVVVALICSLYISSLSLVIAHFRKFTINLHTVVKIVGLSLISVCSLIMIILLMSVFAGLYVYKKREDPDNFLVPITTSVADLGSMLLFSLFIYLIF